MRKLMSVLVLVTLLFVLACSPMSSQSEEFSPSSSMASQDDGGFSRLVEQAAAAAPMATAAPRAAMEMSSDM